MSAQESTKSFGGHPRRRILAGLLCIGLLGLQSPGQPTRSDDPVFVPVSQHVPDISPGTPLSQIPMELRELWKFRLTRNR